MTLRLLRHALSIAGALAALVFGTALGGFGGALEGYSQLVHPVALLGARGIPHAAGFNVSAFLVPGLLAAWVAWRARSDLRRGAPPWHGLGWTLALLSALAFAGQGVFPLDPANLDAPESRRHALFWMAWWIAFVPAGLLLAIRGRGPALGGATARWHAAGAAWVLVAVAILPGILGAAIAQRAAFAGWMAWLAWVAWQRRGAADASRGGS